MIVRKHDVFVLIAAMLLLCVFPGCDSTEEPSDESGTALSEQTDEPESAVASRDVTKLHFEGDLMPLPLHIGQYVLHGFPIEGELHTKPFTLHEPYTLYFVPAVEKGDKNSIFRLEALVDGDAVELYHRPLQNPHGAIAYHFVVRTELASFTGKTIVLRWSYYDDEDGGAPARGIVGGIELYPTHQRPTRPDIVLICSDAHRYDFSLTPEAEELMPAFTRFCRDSVVFHNAYANSTWTIPSTTALLTGLEPFRHGTGWRVDVNQELLDRAGVDSFIRETKFAERRNYNIIKHNRKHLTIQEALKELGYYNVCFTENSWLLFAETLEDGFDFVGRPSHLKRAGLGNHTLEDVAARIFRHRPEQAPLFLYLHSNHVHDYINDEPILSARENKRESLDRDELLSCYKKRVQEFDEQFDILIQTMKNIGIYENAIIIFFSDHGEILMDCDSTYGHGKQKDESLLRVPLVLKMPANAPVAQRARFDHVQLVDLASTIVDMALGDVALDSLSYPFRGVSLLGAALHGDLIPARSILSGFQFYSDEIASVRQDPWKYIYNFTREEGRLINLVEQDDCDTRELSGRYPAKMDELHALLMQEWEYFLNTALREETDVFEQISEEQRAILESMGYL